MRLEIEENTRIIHNISHPIDEFVNLIENKLNSYLDLSLILNIKYNTDLKINDLKLFNNIQKAFSKEKLSFVVVNDSLNLTNITSKIMVVPTLDEAHDIIQLDNIQRELGF